jgi:hypothetical protein
MLSRLVHKYANVWAELYESVLFLPRAEGPLVSSPARQGRGLQDPPDKRSED